MEPTNVQGDLLEQDVEGIVNAWNRNIIPWWLLLPQGASGAIKKRGGYSGRLWSCSRHAESLQLAGHSDHHATN